MGLLQKGLEKWLRKSSLPSLEIADILGKPFIERFVRKDILDKFNVISTNTGAVICFFTFSVARFSKGCSLLYFRVNWKEAQRLFDSIKIGPHAWDVPADSPGSESSKSGLRHARARCCHFRCSRSFGLSV